MPTAIFPVAIPPARQRQVLLLLVELPARQVCPEPPPNLRAIVAFQAPVAAQE
ncbi:MAG: hypothetical protein ABJB69_04355 [Spartobacteria bacterium]